MSMVRNATWTLSNFCRGKNPPPDWAHLHACLPSLAKLVYSLDEEILIDSCWAISYLSDGPNEKIQAVIESGVPRRLVELLMHPSPPVQTPALRSVGNIVTGDDMQTQVMINCGVLPALVNLLSSPKDGIRKEACWTISNITAGNTEQIQAVIDSGIIPPLIHLLNQSDFKTKKEACWAISNATSGGLAKPEQIRYLVEQGCIRPLCDLLSSMDNKIIQVALDALENILKVGQMDRARNPPHQNDYAFLIEDCGGMEKIHNAQQNANQEIYKKAYDIIDQYSSILTLLRIGILAMKKMWWMMRLRHLKLEVNFNLVGNGVDNHNREGSTLVEIKLVSEHSSFYSSLMYTTMMSHSAIVLCCVSM
jgi:importin subunit alpha-6/7